MGHPRSVQVPFNLKFKEDFGNSFEDDEISGYGKERKHDDDDDNCHTDL